MCGFRAAHNTYLGFDYLIRALGFHQHAHRHQALKLPVFSYRPLQSPDEPSGCPTDGTIRDLPPGVALPRGGGFRGTKFLLQCSNLEIPPFWSELFDSSFFFSFLCVSACVTAGMAKVHLQRRTACLMRWFIACY